MEHQIPKMKNLRNLIIVLCILLQLGKRGSNKDLLDLVLTEVFLLCQLWIIKSSSNNLSDEKINTGVSREMVFEK